MNMVAHAYDLFFYLSSWSTFSFLWHEQRGLVITLIAALLPWLMVGGLAWLAARRLGLPRRFASGRDRERNGADAK